MKHNLISLVKQELIKTETNPHIYIEKNDFKFKLISFMESNNWFNLNPTLEYDDGNNPMIVFKESELDSIQNEIVKWLHVYDSNQDEQYYKLQKMLSKDYILTSKMLKIYYDKHEVGLSHKIEITEYLLFKIKLEILNYDNEMLEAFVNKLCKDKNLTLGMIVCDFLDWLRENSKTSYTNKFKLSSRNTGRSNNNAYDGETYLKLLYYLFNEDYIEENNTTEKIATSSKSANAFLYLSLHFICGLRDSDLMLLPRPIIENKPMDILNSINDDTFSTEDARKISSSVEFQIHHLSYKPSKTKRYTGVTDLKFFIPESCREIIGIYFAAAEAHMQLMHDDLSRQLISVVSNPYDLGEAMGEDFFEIFLYENFRSKRANKAYLQALEGFANNLCSKISSPKGYILAALARSHKGSYGEFSDITEVYLKDSHFTGLSPDFVAKELFERGVCSFLSHMLLMMLESNDYNKLPIQKQTLMIKELGMVPNEVECIVGLIEDKKNESIKIINEIVSINKGNIRQSIIEILHNIGSESAASKQNESLCLLTAMNRICLEPERQHCIGCLYEIKTKSLIYHLTGEYKRLKNLINETENKKLKCKYEAILLTVILPAIEEMLEYTHINYGAEGVGELEDIVRRYSV